MFHLDAKVDTGAYTSSLHCHKVTLEIQNDQKWVRFFVLDPDHPEYEKKAYDCPVHKIKRVKSSNGLVQNRIIVRQKARFLGEERVIELSLADRTEMKYPVLLGRKFLSGKYVVDVSRKFLLKKDNSNE